MKKTLLIPLLLVLGLFVLVGCGEGTDEAADTAGEAVEAAGEAVEGAEEAVEMVCSACGMKMAADQMVEVDGKTYCSHCSPDEEHDHDHDHGDHDGHDHG